MQKVNLTVKFSKPFAYYFSLSKLGVFLSGFCYKKLGSVRFKIRFGPVRFSTRGSAEHRTFKIPGSVVLYCRDMMQNFFDGAGTLLSKCSVIIVLSLTP